MNKVLILGGYGNFGRRIAAALVKKGAAVTVAGRSREKAARCAARLGHDCQAAAFDIRTALPAHLDRIKPKVVVNTCGPFQTSDYHVARTCIAHGVHYIDLADGRAFVTGIGALDAAAKDATVSIISGASTVPGLSSAVLQHYREDFDEIDTLTYGISPGQGAERGLATTQGVLSYVGKPLRPFSGIKKTVYGWQDLYRQAYPELGRRWMANCDIPDLDLLPQHYPIRRIQFSAGLELSVLHLGLWALSWMVRWGIPIPLARLAAPLLKASDAFNRFGTSAGGMHMILHGTGRGANGVSRPKTLSWFIIAKSGHGPHIPTVPAIVLAHRLLNDNALPAGAYACIGLVPLADYLNELKEFDIAVRCQ